MKERPILKSKLYLYLTEFFAGVSVMETHPAYAVVLDINGAFRKVANLGYRVGDRVTDVVVMRPCLPRRLPTSVVSKGRKERSAEGEGINRDIFEALRALVSGV